MNAAADSIAALLEEGAVPTVIMADYRAAMGLRLLARAALAPASELDIRDRDIVAQVTQDARELVARDLLAIASGQLSPSDPTWGQAVCTRLVSHAVEVEDLYHQGLLVGFHS